MGLIFYHSSSQRALIFPIGVNANECAFLIASLSSFACDYVARQKVGGTHLTYGYLNQLPILSPSIYTQSCNRSLNGSVSDWLLIRIVELNYTAWDVSSFAQDCGFDCPPFRWDEERRFLLRSELDAAFFHLYGIDRDDVDYIMETFPIVKRRDEASYGEYRTKQVILEIFDAMRLAMDTAEPYQTRLDPPPADPRCCHPPRSGTDPMDLP